MAIFDQKLSFAGLENHSRYTVMEKLGTCPMQVV